MKKAILGTSFLTLTQMVSNAALVWHSEMNGNADAVVGPNGVAVGSPTATADRFGNPDSAVKFDGATDYYNLGTISTTLSAGSMAFWARTDVHGNDKGPVAMGISGGGASEYFVIQDRLDGSWRADVDNGASRLDAFDNNPPVTTGTWHHVAATFSAGGNLTVYINGVAQTDVQAISAAHALENLGDWTIGAERIGSRFYNGALDDVRLYDNELSAQEVASLAAIPEPSTTALFGLAGLALLRRRRA